MKIRTDFVTNSSSSSFVAVNAENNALTNFLKENGISESVFDEIGDYITGGDGFNGFFSYDEFAYSPSTTLLNLISEARNHGWRELDKNKYIKLKKYIENNKNAIDESSGNLSISSYLLTDDVKSFYIKVSCNDGKCELLKCFEEDGAPKDIAYVKDNKDALEWLKDLKIDNLEELNGELEPWALKFGSKQVYESKEIEILENILKQENDAKLKNEKICRFNNTFRKKYEKLIDEKLSITSEEKLNFLMNSILKMITDKSVSKDNLKDCLVSMIFDQYAINEFWFIENDVDATGREDYGMAFVKDIFKLVNDICDPIDLKNDLNENEFVDCEAIIDFNNKIFCSTYLNDIENQYLSKTIKNKNCTFTSNYSKKIDYLIVGEEYKDSSKYNLAVKYKNNGTPVKIFTFRKFARLSLNQ